MKHESDLSDFETKAPLLSYEKSAVKTKSLMLTPPKTILKSKKPKIETTHFEPKTPTLNTFKKHQPYKSKSASKLVKTLETINIAKKVPGTNFLVDCFKHGKVEGCENYFLTHFHSDHYGGLNKNFSYGKILCSNITAELIKEELKVKEEFIIKIELNKRYKINDFCSVTLYDANHCPGAVLLLFEVSKPSSALNLQLSQKTILHTGDFRYDSEQLDKHLSDIGLYDYIFLDTTYLNEKHSFPKQRQIVKKCAQTIYNKIHCIENSVSSLDKISQWCKWGFKIPQNNKKKKALIVVGTYTIGKEKIFKEIANLLNIKVFANPRKRRILRMLGDNEIEKVLVDKEELADLHLAPMRDINIKTLSTMLDKINTKNSNKYEIVIGVRPTGWTFDQKKGDNPEIKNKGKGRVVLYEVPYSEHSSFKELEEFVLKYSVKKHETTLKKSIVVPTVGLWNEKLNSMHCIIDQWQNSSN